MTQCFVAIVLLGGAIACVLVNSSANTHIDQATINQKKPNIIFILADNLGYGDLGSYGQRYIKTPFLDRLAKDGIRYSQFYASCPVCAPSRASFMTGLHQGHAYIRGNTDQKNQRVSLRKQDLTIGEVLKKAGYRTGVIGKWGLGEPGTDGTPNRKGFDYWFGYLNQNLAHNYYPDYLWRNEEKVAVPERTYAEDLISEESLNFIRREYNKPFFLFLSFTLPHANNELGRSAGNGMQVPSDARYATEKWSPQQKNYAAMVSRLDSDVGRVLELLTKLRLDDNTVVMFTSDNGPQGTDEGGYDQSLFKSNGGLRGLKRELYEGGIREPMIVRWSGKIKPGQTSDKVWVQYDLLSTFAEIAGNSSPGGVDGISMLPALLGNAETGHQFIYWEFHEGGYSQAVRLGDWKGVRHGLNGPIELYDLKTDVKETRDLATGNAGVVNQIAKIMSREHVESPNWPDK